MKKDNRELKEEFDWNRGFIEESDDEEDEVVMQIFCKGMLMGMGITLIAQLALALIDKI